MVCYNESIVKIDLRSVGLVKETKLKNRLSIEICNNYFLLNYAVQRLCIRFCMTFYFNTYIVNTIIHFYENQEDTVAHSF